MLHFDQINNRKEKSAINAAISLLSDIANFYKKNDNSTSNLIINLVFITQKLSENIFDWYINEFNALNSDYKIIKFNIRIKAVKLIKNCFQKKILFKLNILIFSI